MSAPLMSGHALNWFEIIAVDFDRACRFYEKALGLPANSMAGMDFGDGKMAPFPTDREHVGGAIWKDARSKPSTDGTRVYLNAEGKIDAILARIPQAGGHVILPKTHIGPPGYIAMFKDTEGNVVGLHSRTA